MGPNEGVELLVDIGDGPGLGLDQDLPVQPAISTWHHFFLSSDKG